MAPFSKPYENIPTRIQQGLIHVDYEHSQELEPYSPSSSTAFLSTESVGSLSGVRRNHSHKASKCRLLAWVAITRNYHPLITPAQRCTCPMVGCEIQFDSPESMHKHLQISSCLSKSTYQCFENGEQVRVGKCDSEGCQELKGRFVSAVNSSIESVKRHLSRRRSKSPQVSQSGPGKETSLREEYLMKSPWDDLAQYPELPVDDHMYRAEMGPQFNGATPIEYGIAAHFVASELDDTTAPSTSIAHLSQSQSLTSVCGLDKATAPYEGREQYQQAALPPNNKLDCILPELYAYADTSSKSSSHSNDNMSTSTHAETTTYNQIGPAELCASGTLGSCRLHQKQSSWWLSSPVTTEQPAAGVHPHDRIATLSAMPSTYFDQSVRHAYQTAAPPNIGYEYSEKMVVDDFTIPEIDDLPGLAYDHRRSVPQMDSNTSSESRISPSTFSTISTISTSQSSMSSYDSSPAKFDYTQPVHTSFLEDDSMIFEEPESMELSESYSHVGSGARRVDTAGVSIDNYVEPGCYLSNAALNRYKVPTQLQATERSALSSPLFHSQASSTIPKDTSNKTPSPSSAIFSPPHSPPSSLPAPSLSQPLSPGKASCRHCGSIGELSNRSRHERTCRQNPDHTSIPRIPCHYPGCTSTFTRKDNLTQHQRLQNHFMIGNVELKICLTPAPGSPVWDLAMEALGQQQHQSAL